MTRYRLGTRHGNRLARTTAWLVGGVLSGNVRENSVIELHVFSDDLESLTATLEEEGAQYEKLRNILNKLKNVS